MIIIPLTRTTLLIVIGGGSNTIIEIREFRDGALPGRFGKRIILNGSGGRKKVAATTFTSRNVYGGRASQLKVFVNGSDTGQILSPSDFIDYVKIVFNVVSREDGKLQVTISGVPARTFDMPRFQ